MEQQTGIKRSRKPRSRRFMSSDVDEMASLLAKRYSEQMACEKLGINYDSWRSFKSRAKNDIRFNSAMARARAKQFDGHISNIEDFETGNGVKRDWRASEALLKLKFPELMPQPNAPAQITNNVTLNIAESIRRAYSADLSDLKTLPATMSQETIQTQIKELPAPANGILEARKLPPKRKGEIR